MTLREIADYGAGAIAGIMDYFAEFFITITTKNILDWDISHFIVIAAALFVVFLVFLQFYDEYEKSASESRATKQKIREMQSRPPDPED